MPWPSAPARAVRPSRCTYCSAEEGMPIWITRVTLEWKISNCYSTRDVRGKDLPGEINATSSNVAT